MQTFGLLGKALTHSFSQQFFTEKFIHHHINHAEYQLFSLNSIDEVQPLLKMSSLFGFNVTIPYKTVIIPYLDELDRVAKEVGAVNCVVKQNGKWVGYNTDVVGFWETLSGMRYAVGGERYAVILGAGGAAKAVGYVLKQHNIPFQMVSRNKTTETIIYHEVTAQLIQNATFIIHATPLGMFPNINEKPPIPYDAIHGNHVLIDLIYNPDETLFLKEGKKRGAFIMNGLQMFTTQAEESFKLFFPNIF